MMATCIYVVMLLSGQIYAQLAPGLLLLALLTSITQVMIFALLRANRFQIAVQLMSLGSVVGIIATSLCIHEFTPFIWFITLSGLLCFLISTPFQVFILTSVCLSGLLVVQQMFLGQVEEEFLRNEIARVFVSIILFSSLAYMKSRLFITAEERFGYNLEETRRALALAHQKREKAISLLSEARHLDDAKTTFLKGMNHELRTPLNAILGYTELLIEEVEDLSQDDDAVDLFAEDARRIQIASRHLLSMLDDVLDLDKIENGSHEDMLLERFDLAELAREVAEAMQHAASINDTTICFAATEQKEFHVKLDPKWMRQILFNFLSNACKFTHSGTIEIGLRRECANLVLHVKDSGRGMSQEDLEAIRQEYVQAKGQSLKEHGGTGLGLPLCYRLVEQMGGELDMQSSPGEGTCVLIRFPWEHVFFDAPQGQEVAAW